MKQTAKLANKPRTKRKARINGRVRVLPQGYGFFQVDGQEDRFLPASQLQGILDGDEISLEAGRDLGKAELVSRARKHVVADVRGIETGWAVCQVDQAIGQLTLRIPAGTQVLNVGDAVKIDLDSENILTNYGPALAERAVLGRILTRHQLPEEKAVEAAKEARDPRKHRRADLRNLHTITIDSESSTDLDDALSAARGPDGSIRMYVHIADVAEAIQSGSDADRQAAAVGTSIYLAGWTRHMLDETVAGGRASLLPQTDRKALTVELRISSEGQALSVDVYESWIHSNRRLTYEQAWEELNSGSTDAQTHDLLRYCHAAAMRLGTARQARGGVTAGRIDPEPAGNTSAQGAHLMIERLMVAANEAVAGWLEDRGLPVIYRVHPAVEADRVAALQESCEQLGLGAHWPGKLTPKSFAILAESAESLGVGGEFWDLVAGKLAKAYYTYEKGGHFGLGSSSYTHFTSPLRRYPDLLTHRVVKAYLRLDRSLATADETVLENVNDMAGRCAKAERDSWNYQVLKDLKVHDELSVRVIGAAGSKLKVKIAGGPVVKMSGTTPSARTHLRVKVKNVDALSGTIELEQIKPRRAAAPRKASRAGRKAS